VSNPEAEAGVKAIFDGLVVAGREFFGFIWLAIVNRNIACMARTRRAPARAASRRPRRLVPVWLHDKRLVLRADARCPGCHPEAAERHLPVGLDIVGEFLSAQRQRSMRAC
jgi:hypothetical protein